MRLHREPESASESSCPATRAAEHWVTKHLGGIAHERQVAAIASELFDLLLARHRLSIADRRLLHLAAIVHDVGRSIEKEEHPAEGAWMILADGELPISPAQRRALAYLTLYHRGPVPAMKRDAILHATDDHDRLLRLLALLRSADALDSRSLNPSRLVFALNSGAKPAGRSVLSVLCYLDTDSTKARKTYRRRKKFRLLEDLLEVRVDVSIACAEALRMVA